MSRSQIILIVAASLIVIFLVLVFTGVIPGLKPNPKTLPPPPPVTQINVWGFNNDSQGWYKVASDYRASHSNVNINYVPVDELNYENKLIDNLAAGTGPDIFLLQNSWVPKFRNKISPAPSDLISPAKIHDLFPQIVTDDFVSGTQVWGLPVSIDTLALAYNRAIFDSKQLVLPPATWDEVKNLVPRIKESNSGTITKSPIALGAGELSIRNATDIFSAILLQLKNKIIDSSARRSVMSESLSGLEGLNFYTDFSDPKNLAYSWDHLSSQNSINSFIDGKTAMVLAYKRDVNEIRSRNPLLNILIAPLPQFDASNPITIANYWGLVVASQAKNQSVAWDFINYAATNVDAAKNYVNTNKLPPALRELIPIYQNDSFMKVFASQILIAQSVQFIQYPTISEALNNMIESTLINRSSVEANLRAADTKINVIIQ